MSPNILSQIETILRETKKLNNEQVEILIQFLKFFKKDNIIYPGAITRKINTATIDTYLALEELKKHGFLETNYELYCHVCNRFNGYIYRTISHIPDESICETCEESIDVLNNSIVVYRVLKDE